jgi:transcriptional regulator with XRE-family HTH domain
MSEPQTTLLDQLVEEIPSAEVRFFDKTDDVAERIRALLDERGMTQRELADAMDKQPSYVSRVLGGAVNLTLKTICAFEDALGADLLAVPTSAARASESAKIEQVASGADAERAEGAMG